MLLQVLIDLIEASRNNWSSRVLDRQIGSFLFDRLAKSKDKEGVLKLAQEGHTPTNPVDYPPRG